MTDPKADDFLARIKSLKPYEEPTAPAFNPLYGGIEYLGPCVRQLPAMHQVWMLPTGVFMVREEPNGKFVCVEMLFEPPPSTGGE